MRMSDIIASRIIELIEASEESMAEIQRNELASIVGCAPSQINYVLSSRVTPEHGYIIESRRGGGGYIRIVRIVRSDKEHMQYLLRDRVGESISAGEAQLLCRHLFERGVINENDAALMMAATNVAALSVPVPETVKDAMRARILRSMLLSVAQRAEGGE